MCGDYNQNPTQLLSGYPFEQYAPLWMYVTGGWSAELV